MRALPLLPLLALAGCVTDQNMTLNTVHQPVVATSTHTIDLAGSGYGLAPGEVPRLEGWFAGFGLQSGDRVSADVPAGPARAAISAVADRYGKLLEPAGTVAGTPGTVRVSVVRATASVPGCPDWRHEQVAPSAGAASRNYGCATNANLAAMIADPRDLLRGRDAGTAADPRVSVKAIASWRDAKPSGDNGLKAESSKGGAN